MDSKRKVPYAKQKITLYFDENMPAVVVEHFRTSSYWRKKVKVVSAGEEANSGRSDEFQFRYCSRKGYVLVSLDGDFNDDQRYGLHPVWMTRS
jgi:predicted nuclease of predicted toxin-antitoxin system